MDALTIRCGGCLCNSCARPLPCTDCIYFPWSQGRGCSEGGTRECRYYLMREENEEDGL